MKKIHTVLSLEDFEQIQKLIEGRKERNYVAGHKYTNPEGKEWLPILKGQADKLYYGCFPHNVDDIEDIYCEYWKFGKRVLNCFVIEIKASGLIKTLQEMYNTKPDEIVEHRLWSDPEEGTWKDASMGLTLLPSWSMKKGVNNEQ